MNPRVSRGSLPKGAGRNSQRRKMVLEVDLNVLPGENFSEGGASSRAPAMSETQAGQQPPQVVPIDVDALDDDVIVSSPRAFAEAKNKLRRNRSRSNVVDVELVESARRNAADHRNKRQRVPANQPVINCESYVILEKNGIGDSVSGNVSSFPRQTRSMVPPPPLTPQEPPTFNCPVCMGPFVEEVSTKCGHIFCKECIKKSIASQGKCPTCRKKVTMKTTIRIYLPATSSN